MKILMGAVVVIILMIGAPTVYALTDSEKEAGIASDAQGRVCNYGASHDQCHDQFLKSKDYQQGFRTGVSDAHTPPNQRVMNDPVNDFEHHSQSFNNGWGDGFCSVMGKNNTEFDCNDDEA